MLYLVSTPIGNLDDITLRALDVLARVDLILCEDTRVSRVLLSHHRVKTPLRSFHRHSEKKQQEELLSQLKQGANIALISDAGTPGINDPGAHLVSACREEEIEVTALPGPCAPIAALIQSGFPTSTFQFIGFIDKKKGERKRQLLSALFYPGVTLFFESPKRIGNTLEELATIAPSHKIAVVREMTKLHEECVRGYAYQLKEREFRGEIVVVLEGWAKAAVDMEPKAHVEHLEKTYSLSKQEAIKLAAELRGISKREIYSHCISDEQE